MFDAELNAIELTSVGPRRPVRIINSETVANFSAAFLNTAFFDPYRTLNVIHPPRLMILLILCYARAPLLWTQWPVLR